MRLYELNQMVHSVIDAQFKDTYWITAELSDVGVHGGHCYLEFVEKSPFSNDIIAKAKGMIWSSTWSRLRPKFEQATGQTLSNGMQVMANVKVTFSEKYGYALVVTDIDPTYTLGDIARRRKEIIDKLKADGVYDLNKELELPFVMNRIAVISSATAAGYQDFCHQLQNNPYGLTFATKLFPAVMQGSNVESSVIQALEDINDEGDLWDVVVIIRGGGATSDLSGFDSYLLGANVAQFTLPVITGIGHERDNTIIDEVSHKRVKTPTAAAEFIIGYQYDRLNHLNSLEDTIINYCTNIVTDEHHRLEAIMEKFPSLFNIRKEREFRLMDNLMSELVNAFNALKIRSNAFLDMRQTLLQHLATNMLTSCKHRISMAETKVESAKPDHLLRLGFSITRYNGKAITDVKKLRAGMKITTTLAEGSFTSTVNEAPPEEPSPPPYLNPLNDTVNLA